MESNEAKAANPISRLAKNIFSNWASMAISILIAFFMSPFLVHNLGKEQYGIWALVLSIMAYSHFLDAGMRQSLARYIPKYYATKNYLKLNQVLSSSQGIYTFTGTLVMLGTLIIVMFFAGLFNVAPEYMRAMKFTLLLVGLNEAFRFYFITASALGPFHRYDIGNIIDIIFTVLNAVLIFYFISQGYELIALAIITVSTATTKFLVRAIYQKRLVPQIEYKIKHVDKATIKEMFNYGIVSFFIVIAWMVIFNSDNVIIGMYLTTTDITYFSIAGMMINYLRTLINAIGIPLVPAISHFDASSDHKEIARLYTKLSRYLYYLTSCIAAGILFFGGKFINLWMGEGFQSTINVLYILIIPAAIYLPQVAANSVLLGISKHKTLLYILIVESVVKIGLSLILIQTMGIYGVAIGTAVPQFLIYLFVYPYLFSKIIGISLKAYYMTNLVMAITASIFVVPISFALQKFNVLAGWPGLIVDVVVFGVLAVVGFWFRVLTVEERVDMLSRFRK